MSLLKALTGLNTPGGEKKPGKETPEQAETRIGMMSGSMYDKEQTYAKLVMKAANKVGGISPDIVMGSAMQEGMNKISTSRKAAKNDISEAYLDASGHDDFSKYPVDGFLHYGLDTFGGKAKDLIKKGYLPKDFDYKQFTGVNEQKGKINTAAFKNNEDALTAKAAMMRDELESYVRPGAAKRGIKLDKDAEDYFLAASFNMGPGGMAKMMDSYVKNGYDSKRLINEGLPDYQKVHNQNIKPRIIRRDTSTSMGRYGVELPGVPSQGTWPVAGPKGNGFIPSIFK